MATENIGSIGLTIEIEDVNTKKVIDKVAEAITEAEDAATSLGDAADDMADSVKTATDKVNDSVTDMTKTVTHAADKINESLSSVDAGTVAEEIDNTNKKIDENTAKTDDAKKGMIGLGQQIKIIKDQLEILAMQGDTQSEQYKVLGERLRELLKIKAQVDKQSILTNDAINFKGAAESAGQYGDTLDFVGENIATLTGEESVLTKAAGALNDTISIGNSVQQISNAFKKDGYIRSTLLTKATQLQATVQQSLTKAFGGSARAANMAKIATYGLSAAVAAATLGLPFLIMGIEKVIEKWQESRQQQEKMAQSIGDAVGESVSAIRKLQAAWTELGDDLSRKEAFVRDNQKAFDDLGVSITNITEAENMLVRNTEKYIRAIMARAKANAAQSILNDKYVDLVKDRAETEQSIADLERRIASSRRDIEIYEDRVANNHEDYYTEYLRQQDKELIRSRKIGIQQLEKQIEDLKKKIKNDEDDFNKENAGLIATINKSEAEAASAMASSGVLDISEFTATLKEKEARYKDYADAIASTDAEIRANAVQTSQVNLSEGKTYTEYLKNLRAQLKAESASLDKDNEEQAQQILINEQKIRAINKELTSADKNSGKSGDKKKPTAEELTEYQRLKAALKEYEDLKAAGYDPKLFEQEQKNLEKQIEEYERLHHLVELPKADYSERIAKMKEFSEKLVTIAEQSREQIEAIENSDLDNDEKKLRIEKIYSFQDSDIEMLKAEYNIVGQDLTDAIMDGMKENLSVSTEEMAAEIIAMRREVERLSNQKDDNGNQVDNSQQIAVIAGKLQDLDIIYKRLKKDAQDVAKEAKKDNAELRKLASDRLKAGIAELADEFIKLGDQIGGRAGDALNFLGNLTNTVMATISNIQRFSVITSKSIEGVSKATATAIKAVESASVILAIISAAMEVTMQLIEIFNKNKDTYEDKKNVYDAYVSTLDIIIDREKKLTQTLEAQQAVAGYNAIGKMIEQQEASTRRIAKDYLNSRERGEHTVGYKTTDRLNSKDWAELQNAIGNQAANAIKQGGRVTGLFDLSAEDLRKVQEKAIGFYSKLDQETRGYIESIIGYDDQMASNIEERMAQVNNISFDEFSNNFVSSLMEMDASADQISKDIQNQMRQALIQDMFKSQYAGKLKDYYEKWAAAMENDGNISETEQVELDTLRESIVNGATAAAKAINDQFRDTAEDIEDEGLSGAIKGASQESIDLLTGQTNAVRMNQVEAMGLAREQLSAVLSIDKNLAGCLNVLKDIRSNTQSNQGSNMRSQGIEI